MRWIWFTAVAALVAFHAAGAAELSATELKDARKLYTVKCAKCHKFYDPAKYNDDEWQTWMRKMSKKSKLKDAQSELLGRYLETFRKPGGTNAAPPDAKR
ncbi:MAG: hypothetical protein EXS35_06235 [Pedosphaera sp.]|nr:hypothetical protein [Pedosphaera sp.]